MDCCMGFSKSNYLTAVILSLVCFKAFTLGAGLSLPALNKQYKQISKNWFITMWEYKSVTGLFIYAYTYYQDIGYTRTKEISQYFKSAMHCCTLCR